jgi:hypothetical protein
VLAAWGFTYITGRVWVKPSIGPGYLARARHQHLLIDRRGRVKSPMPQAQLDSVIEAPRGRHSE